MKIAPWPLIGLILFCNSALSATVTGKLSGERLQWLSGRGDDHYLRSNAFDRPSGLPITSNWFPGTFATSTNKLIMTSDSGETVEVNAKLVGSTYVLAAGYAVGEVPPVGVTCPEQQLSGYATVLDDSGSFCVANKSIQYSSAVSPFSQFQPILKLERSALISAFRGKGTGTYTGVVTGTLRYGFYVNAAGSALSYRNIPVSFSVQIRNLGSQLSRVSVVGSGHITPQYNTYKHTASGLTGYKVTAYGSFETGVRFRFVGKAENDYTLKSTDSPLAKKIAYSIECAECTPNTLLVDEGILVAPETWSKVEQSGRSVYFDLKIRYDGIHADDVVDGRYQDSFTLMLEAIL
ncbi:hypothetical protein HL669_23710 [Vibrio parahaemolyticus]|uniref:hypothetical protein n=1 Tax=Vibrio parahaemolyticus TaxID=670 RepID=UPI0014857FCD|nr:hypothetical protein [Vibrio parahaemolyticus]NNU14601.1 hypothetical protein [Vibrio parahaemolyticus]